MNILAFNGSPRMKKGQTDIFLQHFMKGAKEAGAETETVYLAKQNIKYCSGCILVNPEAQTADKIRGNGRSHLIDLDKICGAVKLKGLVHFS